MINLNLKNISQVRVFIKKSFENMIFNFFFFFFFIVDNYLIQLDQINRDPTSKIIDAVLIKVIAVNY